MNVTNIEWTTFSANPLKYRDADGKSVWACVHASKGCEHCYAETLAKRYGRGGPFNVPTTNKVTPYLDEKELRQMLTAKSIKGVRVSGSRVFLGDMTDIFGEWVPDEILGRLFAVMAQRPDVTFQLLTKRAKRMHHYMTAGGYRPTVFETESELYRWPLRNVWLGVSAEDQQRADERIPLLLQTPAAVRFVSAEPLLGPIDFRRHQLGQGADCDDCGVRDVAVDEYGCCQSCGNDAMWYGLDWVIPGGESNGRECDVEWIRSIVRQCAQFGTACFVKQLGSRPRLTANSVELHGLKLTSKKGGDPSEWPADLRVRQFPTAESAEWRERRSAR